MADSRVLCHLIASGFAGGPEKQIIEACPYLARLGWRVVVGSFLENRPGVEVIENARAGGIETFLIDTRSPFDPRSVFQLRRNLMLFGVDVLITHGYKPNIVGRLAASGLDAVHLPMVRGYTAEDWKVGIYERLDRLLLRRTPRVLAVSGGMKRKLVAFGVDGSRIEVLHNAVDSSPAIEAVDLASEFSLPDDAQVILAAGRLSPEKGHTFLIAAIGKLRERFPLLHAVVLGSGREKARLEAQITNADLCGRVILGGFRRPVLGYLAAADIVVNPSLTEGLPNVVLEAMSVRTPVVATDVGGVSEIVVPGETGWLVPPGDAAALADGIGEALANADRAREYAEAGRLLLEGSFSFQRQAQRLTELLNGGCVPIGADTLRARTSCGEVFS